MDEQDHGFTLTGDTLTQAAITAANVVFICLIATTERRGWNVKMAVFSPAAA